MGCNFYIREKSATVFTRKLCEVADWRFEDMLLDPDQEVRLKEDHAAHIAKTSYGWTPSFQQLPADRPFDCTERNNDYYEIKSVADIKAYMDTGRFEIVDEDGEVYDWDGFESRVLKWEDNMRRHGYQGEMRDHLSGDSLDAYADPEGYQFCRVCFC